MTNDKIPVETIDSIESFADVAEQAQGFFDINDSIMQSFVEKDTERVEQALREAILNDYDGVDINRHPPHEMQFGIASIEPWHYPEPDGDNGYLTERYEWKWFDRAELKRMVRENDFEALL